MTESVIVSDRRRSSRILIDLPIRARVVGVDAEVVIAEVSFGGFRVEGPVAFERNVEYEFLVVPRVGYEVTRLHATAVHCRVLSTERIVLFETAFAFAKGAGSTGRIQAFIGNVLSALAPS